MNKKLIVIVFLLWSSAYCAFGQANQWGPFDPGALRNDGSNASSAATVRDNLGLGTMAVATSTDYVATDTFTGHTDATGASVHGLGTISTFASTDYVATSSLAERLDTANASFSEDIDVDGDVGAATLGITGHSTLTTASATALEVRATGSYKGGIKTKTGGVFIAVDAATSVITATALNAGDLYVRDISNGTIARFSFINSVVTEVSDPSSAFSISKDNASTINVYIESGSIVIQNKGVTDPVAVGYGAVFYD